MLEIVTMDQDRELLGTLRLGPDDRLITAGTATELVIGWRLRGYSDRAIYEMLPGWSNGYVQIVPGMPDEDTDLGKVDEGEAGRIKARNLIKWFNRGAGGTVPWGSPGDFDACVAQASRHMRPDQAKGFCNLRHKDATGAYPGHAPGERHKADAPDNPPDRPRPHHEDTVDHHAGPDYTPADLGVHSLWTIAVDPQLPNVDRQHYQRDMDLDRVKEYEDEPRKKLKKRWGLLGRREDGSLWIINGQHHTLAAIGRGIHTLHYRGFDSDGPEHEAQVYNAWEDWHAKQEH